MASNGEFIVEDALNILESLTELNGNLRNEVKKDILTAVSRIKHEFVYLRSEAESANRRITELEARATQTHSLLPALLDGMGRYDDYCTQGSERGEVLECMLVMTVLGSRRAEE